MGLLSALGAIGSAAAPIVSSATGPLISGLFGSRDTDKTNSTNKAIAQDNLAFQRENLDYQKALQQQIFQREDSAYQRTVSDMRAAGLSPLAMNGTNGAGEAIQTEAPQNSFQRQGKNYSFIGQATNNAVQTATELMRLKNESDKADAEVENIKANTASILANTDFFNASASARLAALKLSNRNSAAQYDNTVSSTVLNRLASIGSQLKNKSDSELFKYNRYFGLNPQMSHEERLGSLALRLSGFDGNLTSVDGKKLVKQIADFLQDSGSSSAFALPNLFGSSSSPSADSEFLTPNEHLDKLFGGSSGSKGLSPAQKRLQSAKKGSYKR